MVLMDIMPAAFSGLQFDPTLVMSEFNILLVTCVRRMKETEERVTKLRKTSANDPCVENA